MSKPKTITRKAVKQVQETEYHGDMPADATEPVEIPFTSVDEDIEEIPAEVEAAADEAVATEALELDGTGPAAKKRERTFSYHAVLRDGTIVQAITQTSFRKALSNKNPDDVLFMVKGKELQKRVQTSITF
jgi:predicted transcriptional regulator